MSAWGWDVTDDMKDLTKRHTVLTKLTKTAPDAAKHKAKKDGIDKQINDKKLEYAQKQFDLEQMKLQLKAARDKFQYHLKQQQLEAKVKEEHYKTLSDAKGSLQAKFSGSKITDPEQRLKDVEEEIRQYKIELQTGDHRSNGERLIIRNIEMKKQEVELIKGYIENNVGEYQKKYEATAKTFSGVMATWKQKVKKTDDASKERELLKTETQKFKDQKDQISEEIKTLSSSKQEIQKAHQKKVKEYEKNRREHADITVAIAMKKNRKIKERETKDIRKKHEQKKAAEEVKKMKKREEELERQKATELKRQKAIDAYNNMQKKLKAKNTSSMATRSSGSSVKKAATASRKDPHAADKETCRSLIVLCESMEPTGRKGKKKKKVRLVYRADSFVKFNQVGVKIPKYAKDLKETIKALNQRIASYDEEVPTEEVPVKEEAPATEEKEAAKEEPEKEAEAEDGAENAI